MKSLKSSVIVLSLVINLISGCQSVRIFEIKTFEKDELHVIEIDSNRVIQECYFMNAEKENNWRHQYILNMLNEKNEVIPVYNPTNQGKSECLAQLKKVDKILKNEHRVKLCVRDKLEKITDPHSTFETHDFGPLGKHESPYHSLTFDTICNTQECYSIGDTCGMLQGFCSFSSCDKN